MALDNKIPDCSSTTLQWVPKNTAENLSQYAHAEHDKPDPPKIRILDLGYSLLNEGFHTQEPIATI